MARSLEELDVLVRQLQGLAATGLHVSGDLKISARPTPDTGWLLCNGASVLRSGYPDLFAAVGTTFGAVDGTHFTLPDLRGRVPVGSGTGSGLTARVLAATGGEESHLLTTAEMPSHGHGVTDPGHSHTGVTRLNIAGNWFTNATQIGINEASSNSATTGISIQNSGGGGSHNNMQPFQVVNWFIKT